MFRQIIKAKARNFSKELCFEEAYNNAYKCFQKSLLKGEVEDIFEDASLELKREKSFFWLLAATLKKFYQE